MAYRDDAGYGMFSWEGKPKQAPRVAFYLAHGYWPVYACHTCNNPACVRQTHLFDGTPKDNVDDCIRKGRAADAKKKAMLGEKHPMAKLTNDQVFEIRSLHEQRVPMPEIAKRYGLATEYARRVAKGKIWKHLKSPDLPSRP